MSKIQEVSHQYTFLEEIKSVEQYGILKRCKLQNVIIFTYFHCMWCKNIYPNEDNNIIKIYNENDMNRLVYLLSKKYLFVHHCFVSVSCICCNSLCKHFLYLSWLEIWIGSLVWRWTRTRGCFSLFCLFFVINFLLHALLTKFNPDRIRETFHGALLQRISIFGSVIRATNNKAGVETNVIMLAWLIHLETIIKGNETIFPSHITKYWQLSFHHQRQWSLKGS